MKVTLLAYTQPNPALQQKTPDELDDLANLLNAVNQGAVTFQEGLIEYSARVCYLSTAKMGHSKNFIPQRIREGHEDIIEHNSATFLIEGISRACSHQLVRHRLASYSQESQRYVDLRKGEWNAVIPPAVAEKPEARVILDDAWQSLEEAYQRLRKLGIRKEDARFLLPNAAETRIVVSMNFRAWRHFIWLRADKAAQWEIRHVAFRVLRELHTVAPLIYRDLWEVFGPEVEEYEASLKAQETAVA